MIDYVYWSYIPEINATQRLTIHTGDKHSSNISCAKIIHTVDKHAPIKFVSLRTHSRAKHNLKHLGNKARSGVSYKTVLWQTLVETDQTPHAVINSVNSIKAPKYKVNINGLWQHLST